MAVTKFFDEKNYAGSTKRGEGVSYFQAPSLKGALGTANSQVKLARQGHLVVRPRGVM